MTGWLMRAVNQHRMLRRAFGHMFPSQQRERAAAEALAAVAAGRNVETRTNQSVRATSLVNSFESDREGQLMEIALVLHRSPKLFLNHCFAAERDTTLYGNMFCQTPVYGGDTAATDAAMLKALSRDLKLISGERGAEVVAGIYKLVQSYAHQDWSEMSSISRGMKDNASKSMTFAVCQVWYRLVF